MQSRHHFAWNVIDRANTINFPVDGTIVKWLGSATDIDEYKIQNRGGSGIKTANVTAKTGPLISAKVFETDEAEVVAMSKKSQVIRVDAKEISVLGRQTQGVRVMKLREGDSIASLICL